MMTMQHFIKKSGLDASLVHAVVRQSGGWEDFKSMAEDVSRHGADAGFSGWTYYYDTCKFWKKNRKIVLILAENDSQEYGQDLLSMIGGFGALQGHDLTSNEIAIALYQGKGDLVDQVENVMAWYALETVANRYDDYVNGY